MKRIIGTALVVLLVLFGGYIYIKILLDAGSDIKGDLSSTPITMTPSTIEAVETITMDTITTTTVPVVEEKEPIIVQSDQGLTVTGALGTSVENRVLIGKDTKFGADVGRVYCLITVTGGNRPTEATHVWYFKGQEKARTELPIKYKKHRTWSYKTIHSQQVGDWRVDVEDSSGNVLKSFSFSVR
jgi:hypothetical protein